MAKTLTVAAIQRLRAGKRRREIPDGGSPGLYLIIQPTGKKSWAMRFRRPSGKSAKLTLGPVDLSGLEVDDDPVIGSPLTLVSARRLAAQIHHERARGRDVVAARHREKLERKARGGKDFAQAANDFVERYAMRKQRRWHETARLLGLRPAYDGPGLVLIPRGLADRWRDRPITEIDSDDIHGIVDEARERGMPGLEKRTDGPSEARARAMFSTLSGMFAWLVEKDRRLRVNPVIGVGRPETSRARDRVLSEAEIIAFWKAVSAERVEFGVPLKLLLLTGCRRDEIGEMERVELSDDGTTLTLPPPRTKNGLTHVLPLPPLARDLIASVPARSTQFVFSTDGRSPIGSWSLLKKRLDAAMGNPPPWVLHDLRRTCATGMAGLGILPHIVEAALNHVSGAKASVAGTYNRAAYAEEKKAALERWSAHIEGLVTRRPTTVVPFPAAVEA
jgi:integrase